MPDLGDSQLQEMLRPVGRRLDLPPPPGLPATVRQRVEATLRQARRRDRTQQDEDAAWHALRRGRSEPCGWAVTVVIMVVLVLWLARAGV